MFGFLTESSNATHANTTFSHLKSCQRMKKKFNHHVLGTVLDDLTTPVGTEQRDSPMRPYHSRAPVENGLLQAASFFLSLKEVCRDCAVKDF